MNGLPYLVWKMMPFFRDLLLELLVKVWETRTVPKSWQIAMIVLLAKSEDVSLPECMRPIALTNCDGKVFFTFVQQRLTRFMTANGLIDRSVQKAFMPRVSGCVEHNQLLWDALKDAKMRQVAICVSWLDLRNAYGSVRHNLIQFALWYYRFPLSIVELIFDYYEGLLAMVSTKAWSTSLFRYGIGVFQGCTMSTILFNITFNLLHEWIKSCPAEPYVLEDGISLRDTFFADDVGFVTRRPQDNQLLLDETEEFIEWTNCMAAKPSKCKSLAFAQFKAGCHHQFVPFQDLGYSAFDPLLRIAGEMLGFLETAMFKYLGRKVNLTLEESEQREETTERLTYFLETVEQKPLLGAMKLWLFNNAIVTRLSWPFMVYDFPLSFIEELDALANQYIKRWVGIPLHGANPVILYLPRKEKGFGITKLTHFFMNMGIVREHLLKYSDDPVIRRLAERRLADAREDGRKKWVAPLALHQAERGLVLDLSMNSGIVGTRGLAYGGVRNELGKLTTAGSRDHRAAVVTWQKTQNVASLLLDLYRLTVQQDWRGWEGVM